MFNGDLVVSNVNPEITCDCLSTCAKFCDRGLAPQALGVNLNLNLNYTENTPSWYLNYIATCCSGLFSANQLKSNTNSRTAELCQRNVNLLHFGATEYDKRTGRHVAHHMLLAWLGALGIFCRIQVTLASGRSTWVVHTALVCNELKKWQRWTQILYIT